ncbi:starch synthase [Paenibacillus cellulosilyticus]|uniref:starch synthase n=1 Tax=Paenibacillus cellulosilyticus TaxID=375489 RepID=A0A2V2YXS2_9BACL|nr:glycogen/starch synthase [Paenibacillus cellulosilyticus]PWW06547.1 starch synthase [Paenibacillus cellulosilyticus]QKS46117.1 glycogen/starch synthase [Paenibacillus cellulosilyticus]
MLKPTWILISPDAFPFSKAGGISDYVYSLACALRDSGYEVDIYTPYYEKLMREPFERQPFEVVSDSISFRREQVIYAIHRTSYEGLRYHFVRQPEFFGRDEIYDRGGRYDRNLNHFSLLGKTMLQDLARRGIGTSERPAVIQGNDIYASLFAAYLDERISAQNAGITAVFCIHNLGEGYIAKKEVYDYFNVDEELKMRFRDSHRNYASWCELMLPLFDRVVTVSDTYARELIGGPSALHALLRHRFEQGDFRGFLNGIDNRFWSITGSPLLQAYRAGASDIREIKHRCKAEVCEQTGFDIDKPLFIFVGRICRQKGLNTIGAIAAACPEAQLLLLGDGEPLDAFIDFEADSGHKLVHLRPYSESLCHRVMAAGDYMIVPSQYEPCGLVAMYAARFGTMPIVKHTGGLIEIAARIGRHIGIGSSYTFHSDDEVLEIVREIHASGRTISVPVEALAALEWKWTDSIAGMERFVYGGEQLVHAAERTQP